MELFVVLITTRTSMKKDNAKEFEEAVRSYVRYEAEQTNRRMTWLGSFEGFLFAAFSLLYTSDKYNDNILIAICCLGFLIASIILGVMYCGVYGIKKVREYSREKGLDPKERIEIFGFHLDRPRWTVFISGEILACYIIMGTWMYLFVFFAL